MDQQEVLKRAKDVISERQSQKDEVLRKAKQVIAGKGKTHG